MKKYTTKPIFKQVVKPDKSFLEISKRIFEIHEELFLRLGKS